MPHTTVIKTRKDCTPTDLKNYEKKWLNDEDSSLSFVDWMYVVNNIFMYNVNQEILDEAIARYKKLKSTNNPSSEWYLHFVEWTNLSSITFTDSKSGRTSQEIIKLYNEHSAKEHSDFAEVEEDTFEEEEEAEPISDVMRTCDAQREEVVQQWSDAYDASKHKKTMTYADYLMIFHKVATISRGAGHVESYNESTYSVYNSGNYMTFPQYMLLIARWRGDFATDKSIKNFADLDKECRKVWFPSKESQPNSQFVKPLATDNTKPPKITERKRGTFTLDDAVTSIQLLEEAAKDNPSTIEKMRLQIAVNYANRLRAT